MTLQEQAFINWYDNQPTFGVDYQEIWDAACKWQLAQIADRMSDAIQSDLENGVKWLNENSYSEFTRKYTALNTLFGELYNEYD